MSENMTKYWKICHDPDLTETGFSTKHTYVKTIWEGFPSQKCLEEEIVHDFCYARFGKKVAYVQGVAPCEGWVVVISNKQEFDEARPVFWGAYHTETKRITLGIGNHGKIRVLGEDVTTLDNVS